MHDIWPSESHNFHHLNGNLTFQSASDTFSPPTIHSLNSPYTQNDLRTNNLIHENEDSKDGASKKTARDPQSHRIIEKRRRDRMNNCLADLSKLIPTSYFKKGRGRIEKTEIIEMAIKHIKHLESHSKVNCVQTSHCDLRYAEEKREEFRRGFRESISEVMRFLVKVNGHIPSDPLCQSLVNQMRDHLAKIMPLPNNSSSSSSSSFSSSSSSSSYSSSGCETATSGSVKMSNHHHHHHHHHRPESTPLLHAKCHVSSPSPVISTIVPNHRIRTGDENRERSASLASNLLENTIRSGSSTPAPICKASSTPSTPLSSMGLNLTAIEYMETETSDYLAKSETSTIRDTSSATREVTENIEGEQTRFKEILKNGIRTTTTGESEATLAPTVISSPSSVSTSSSSSSSSIVDTKKCINLVITSKSSSESNGNGNSIRSDSISPSSEYRFYKKGIKERFQSAMKQEHKRSCLSSTSSLDSHVTQRNAGSQSTITAPTNESPRKCDESRHLSSKPWHIHHPHQPSTTSQSTNCLINLHKVFKYKEKVITNLPAFALHPNGNFYIPLTINPQLISHWFKNPETEDLYTILHPVSIPVNFNYIQRLNHLCPTFDRGELKHSQTYHQPTIITKHSQHLTNSKHQSTNHSSPSSHLLLSAN